MANVALDAWVADAYGDDMQGVFLLVVVTVSGVVYHLAQKGAGKASLWPTLAIAYGTAFAATLVLSLRTQAPWPTRTGTTVGLLIGLSALGIEVGFSLLYRAGWPLASASVITGVAGTAILALVGIFVLGESVTVARVVGISLAVAAGILITKG